MTRIGDPLEETTLYGPLHSRESIDKYKATVQQAINSGGKVEFGGKVLLFIYCVFKQCIFMFCN